MITMTMSVADCVQCIIDGLTSCARGQQRARQTSNGPGHHKGL